MATFEKFLCMFALVLASCMSLVLGVVLSASAPRHPVAAAPMALQQPGPKLQPRVPALDAGVTTPAQK